MITLKTKNGTVTIYNNGTYTVDTRKYVEGSFIWVKDYTSEQVIKVLETQFKEQNSDLPF